MGAQGLECHDRVQKKWCLGRAKAYLEKSVADNHAGTYGAHPTIPLLTEWVSCEPVWGEDMAVEWQDYAPAPLVRIEVGPPDKKSEALSSRRAKGCVW